MKLYLETRDHSGPTEVYEQDVTCAEGMGLYVKLYIQIHLIKSRDVILFQPCILLNFTNRYTICHHFGIS